MIFGSTLLEVAIGVIFVFLLVSMLCSAISELLEAFLKNRAKDLEKGIIMLLDNQDLAKDFFDHPLIKPLGKSPSYIPARTFSLALWNLATTRAAQAQNKVAGVTQQLSVIRGWIEQLDVAKYKNIQISLLALIDEAGSDITKARSNIEGWYNDAMDRVSGWYKRRVQFILIGLGFITAALLNVDTINIAKVLWYNDSLRAAVVKSAEQYVAENPAPTPSPATQTPTPAATPNPAAAPAPTTSPTPAATPSASPSPTPTAQEQAAKAREKISNIRGMMNELGLPIGWASEPEKPDPNDEKYKLKDKDPQYTAALAEYDAYPTNPRRFPSNPQEWFLKILGILLTAMAVSQGAPFWFDLLNKFIVIRSTVKPQEKSRTQPSKDEPAPDTTKKQKEESPEEDDDNKG